MKPKRRDWLFEYRMKLGMTQEEVAEKADIHRTFYNHIERGSRRPSVEAAKKIAHVLQFEWQIFFED